MIKLKSLMEGISNSYAYGGWLSPKGRFFITNKMMDHDRAADELIERFHLKPKINGDGTTMLGSFGWLRIVVRNYPITMTVDTIISYNLPPTKEQKVFIESWLFEDIDRTAIINKKEYSSGDIIS